MTGTDAAWESWGARDPYYGVLTDPRFRGKTLTPPLRTEFFASGHWHVEHVIAMCRRYLDPAFAPQRVLDFGCGVGRLLIPFARIAPDVVGMDVAPSMLSEARRNCDEHGLNHVSLLLSDDSLSAATGAFDLVHSSIVLQHIEIARGRRLFASLVAKVKAGGCGAIHVTLGLDLHATSFGQPPPAAPVPPPSVLSGAKAIWQRWRAALARAEPASAADEAQECMDPEMQMNYYNLSELMFVMFQAGAQSALSEFTDHGGAIGATMYFRKPMADPTAVVPVA